MQLKLMLRSVGYVMHMRRKVVKRTEEKFYVGGEEIGIVEECKYLGCVVNEHLHSYCIRMVEERRGRKMNKIQHVYSVGVSATFPSLYLIIHVTCISHALAIG